MRISLSMVVVGGLVSLANADSKQSATHVMKVVDGETIHIANQGGAINRHAESKVEVEVFSNFKVIVTDSGFDREHKLYSGGQNKDEETKWVVIWNGTWAIAGKTMTLDLTLYDRKCSKTEQWDKSAPKVDPCDPADKQVKMTCTLGQTTLEDWQGTKQVNKTVASWTCAAPDTAKLAPSPRSWVLGKAGCIQVALRGRGGAPYRPCKATP